MIAALIPAAGSSTRLGQPKLLLTFDGQSLIGRLVNALREGGADRVVVVAPPDNLAEGPAIAHEARCAGALVVVPLARPQQMRDSIELGLHKLATNDPPRSLLLTPGDCPGITAGLVGQLLRHAALTPDQIVIPTHHGRRGHPVAFPWAIAAQIPSLPPGIGVNALVTQHASLVVEMDVGNPDIVADLDTPADLRAWQERESRYAITSKSGFRVNVRLFAVARDRAGCSELEVELIPGSTVAELRALLGQLVPALSPMLATAMIAVNEEYAGDDVLIGPRSRLAVIPPVSGGAGECPMKGLIP